MQVVAVDPVDQMRPSSCSAAPNADTFAPGPSRAELWDREVLHQTPTCQQVNTCWDPGSMSCPKILGLPIPKFKKAGHCTILKKNCATKTIAAHGTS